MAIASELLEVLPLTTVVNDENHLVIGGCDTVSLASEFGTPLYVYDEEHLRSQCRRYRDAFASQAETARVVFAGKSFCSLAMCRIADEEGLSLDVSTGGELAIGLAARFPAERIYFHGNNKSTAELEQAIEAGVGRIVVDSFDELERLEEIHKRRGGAAPRILLRITPGIEAHTHEFIRTGQLDSKFGFGVADGVATEALSRASASAAVELMGIHAHIGSQILLLHSYAQAVEVLIGFMADVRETMEITLRELNLGGGLGIAYTADDTPETIEDYAATVIGETARQAEARSFPVPSIAVEPGRSIVGNAGVTLYRVGTIKEIPGVRTYVAVDGGMTDNLRPMLYDAEYEAFLANRADDERSREATIAGKHCESGDVLVKEAKLPASLEIGDILVTPATGAYGWVMSNNYNGVPRPAVVFVRDGKARVVVRRETYDDALRLQSE